MAYHSAVLVKQVPDTANITGKAMKDDGTVNRGALPAIFNPEDLNALEMALQLKEEHGGEVTVVTMGPPRAADILRQALYRGADRVILLSDRKFAGSDTLATSYALKCAVERIGQVFGPCDLVFCGRQAIDGDTAQVGPQVAEKLGWPQITYAESIRSLVDGQIVVDRAFPLGKERVRGPVPCLLTVVESANEPRPPSVRRMIRQKLAATPFEYDALLEQYPEFESPQALEAYLAGRGQRVEVWSAADVGADESMLGLSGSPTKVLDIDYVVLESNESKAVEAEPEAVSALIRELVDEYIL